MELPVRDLSGPSAAIALLEAYRKAGKRQLAVNLNFLGCRNAYPNGVAPLAAVIHRLIESDCKITFSNISGLGKKISIGAPVVATKANLDRASVCWNTLWMYEDDAQVFSLAKALIESLIKRVAFSPGVLEALSWCLFEILDNVLLHSEAGRGMVMLQYLRKSAEVVVCIADSGMGIHQSFVRGKGPYKPLTAAEALELSVQQWTSSTGERRGNGLYGLARVVEENGGRLELQSGRARLLVSPGHRLSAALPDSEQLVIDSAHHCTLVDFQLNASRPVSLTDILGVEGYNTELEPLEDDTGRTVVPMLKYASSVATREGATHLRIRLLNYLAAGAEVIVLDFAGIGLISSSFADETVGKLVEHFGLVRFRELFRMEGTTPTVKALVDRAVSARSSF